MSCGEEGAFLCLCTEWVSWISLPSQESPIDSTTILSFFVECFLSAGPFAWQERPREMPHGPTCGRHPSGQAGSAPKQLVGTPGDMSDYIDQHGVAELWHDRSSLLLAALGSRSCVPPQTTSPLKSYNIGPQSPSDRRHL